MTLLCLVRPELRSRPACAPLQGAAFRLAARFCCMDVKSKSPAVQRVAAARGDMPDAEPSLRAEPALAALAARCVMKLPPCPGPRRLLVPHAM